MDDFCILACFFFPGISVGKALSHFSLPSGVRAAKHCGVSEGGMAKIISDRYFV